MEKLACGIGREMGIVHRPLKLCFVVPFDDYFLGVESGRASDIVELPDGK
jgi:hypothetical protein